MANVTIDDLSIELFKAEPGYRFTVTTDRWGRWVLTTEAKNLPITSVEKNVPREQATFLPAEVSGLFTELGIRPFSEFAAKYPDAMPWTDPVGDTPRTRLPPIDAAPDNGAANGSPEENPVPGQERRPQDPADPLVEPPRVQDPVDPFADQQETQRQQEERQRLDEQRRQQEEQLREQQELERRQREEGDRGFKK